MQTFTSIDFYNNFHEYQSIFLVAIILFINFGITQFCLFLINKKKGSTMRADALDFARGVEKQLDEYRELLENIEAATGYFSSDNGEFSIGHAAMLDDYLCHIYTLRHDVKPNEAKPITYLRQKPLFIDKLKAPQASPSS